MSDDITPTGPSPARRRPWVSLLKVIAVPLIGAISSYAMARLHASEEAAKGTKQTTVAYETLAPKTNDQLTEIKVLKKDMADMAATIELLRKLALANQPGFTPAGAPVAVAPASTHTKKTKRAPRPAPALVKQVQDDAAKTLKEVKERAQEPVPNLAPVPTTIPKEPPPPVDAQKPAAMRGNNAARPGG